MTKKERYQHYIINPSTGEKEYFFPMEIETTKDDESGSDYLKVLKDSNYEIGMSKIGFREFMALLIPVGSKEEHDLLIKDELDKQDKIKADGRCFISAKIGGTKRCPRQIPNPNYVEGGKESKTIMKSCEGCPYYDKKHAHTVVTFSSMQTEDEEGETQNFEPTNPIAYNSADQYNSLVSEFLEYVKVEKPKLVELATLLCQEYIQTEAANIIGKSTSTIGSQTDKLKELICKFLDIKI